MTTSKSEMPRELRVAIKIELQRLSEEGIAAQATLDRVNARSDVLRKMVEVYAEEPVTPVLAIAPPERLKRVKEAKKAKPKKAREPAAVAGLSRLNLIKKVLKAEKRPMSGLEMLKWVRSNLWPNCPQGFAAAPYGYLKDGRLVKDGALFKLPDEQTPTPRAAAAKLPVPAKPAAAKPPPPRPAAPPPEMTRRTFSHNGGEVLMSSKHCRLVERLKSTMGKGYLPAQACVAAAFGQERHPPGPEDWLRSEQPFINEAIKQLGLTMVVEKAGVFLREVENAGL